MFAEAIKTKIHPATWSVIGVKDLGNGQATAMPRGTAFAVTNRGHLLTCWHVTFADNECKEDCSSYIVTQTELGGIQYNAKLVARDKNRDLALLEINGAVKTYAAGFVDVPIPWGRSCCSFGHPLMAVDAATQSMRINTRATSGIVSMPYSAERFPGTTPVRLYELDFFAHGGASGGAVFLRTGEVFAVVSGSQLVDHGTGQATRSNLAIGIDSREAIEFLKGLNVNPQIRRGVR